MPSGSSFYVRQTNPKVSNLKLELLGSDSRFEPSYTIPNNGEWVKIGNITIDCVPFIVTPYGSDEIPTIEIKEKNNTKELTYFYQGDNETEFFSEWNTNNHSFSVIEGSRVTFLISIKDKEKIINNG